MKEKKHKCDVKVDNNLQKSIKIISKEREVRRERGTKIEGEEEREGERVVKYL